MTCLVAWIGVDNRGHTSCYLLADSRFSWPDQTTWDNGRKVYCSRKSPDIWGYYGDVIFPATAISQISEAVNEELIDLKNDSFSIFKHALEEQQLSYPKALSTEFGVVHCHRSNNGFKSTFEAHHLHWSPNKGWNTEFLPIPKQSGLIDCFGSGKAHFKKWNSLFDESDSSETSRSKFQAFCVMLIEAEEEHKEGCKRKKLDIGGSPQLVSLKRHGNGKQHGIVWNGEAWLAGLRLSGTYFNSKSTEFFNANFERCDPTSLKRLKDAQPQPFPKKIKTLLASKKGSAK